MVLLGFHHSVYMHSDVLYHMQNELSMVFIQQKSRTLKLSVKGNTQVATHRNLQLRQAAEYGAGVQLL